jgi:cytochrome P450
MPFSRGNRTCVGQSLASMITAHMIARVVWDFDVRLAPEVCYGGVAAGELRAHHEYDSFIGLRTKGPLMQVRRR